MLQVSTASLQVAGNPFIFFQVAGQCGPEGVGGPSAMSFDPRVTEKMERHSCFPLALVLETGIPCMLTTIFHLFPRMYLWPNNTPTTRTTTKGRANQERAELRHHAHNAKKRSCMWCPSVFPTLLASCHLSLLPPSPLHHTSDTTEGKAE